MTNRTVVSGHFAEQKVLNGDKIELKQDTGSWSRKTFAPPSAWTCRATTPRASNLGSPFGSFENELYFEVNVSARNVYISLLPERITLILQFVLRHRYQHEGAFGTLWIFTCCCFDYINFVFVSFLLDRVAPFKIIFEDDLQAKEVPFRRHSPQEAVED